MPKLNVCLSEKKATIPVEHEWKANLTFVENHYSMPPHPTADITPNLVLTRRFDKMFFVDVQG